MISIAERVLSTLPYYCYLVPFFKCNLLLSVVRSIAHLLIAVVNFVASKKGAVLPIITIIIFSSCEILKISLENPVLCVYRWGPLAPHFDKP